MKEKLREFLRPRLAVLLAAALLAAYLPAMPAVRAAGEAPADAWEDQDEVQHKSFAENGTELASYTYYYGDGTAETVTVDHGKDPGSKENPFSIPDETALILFGKQERDSTKEKYYILDKPGGKYDMGAHTMLPLMGTYTSATSMSSQDRPFQGVLIGNGASIENVYVKSPDTNQNNITPGLFGILDGAEVMDLAVSLTYFDQRGASSFDVGGIAATVQSGGAALVNLTAKVSAADESRFRYVGGLVGLVSSGNSTLTLTNCTAEVTGNLTAYYRAGGLVGAVNGKATLTDCAAKVAGSLTAGNGGGLVGCVDWGGTMTLTDCAAEVAGSLTAGSGGGLVGYVEVESGTVTLENCTAKVEGSLTAGDGGGGLVGGVYLDGGTMTLTNCTAEVMGSLTATGEDGDAGGLVGYVEVDSGTVTLADCTAQAVITKPESGSYAPSGPVGDGNATFSGANITTLRMGADSSVSLALVNNTALTLDDSGGVLKATGNAAGSGTTGSVEVTSNGGAVIQVYGGSDPDGRTYTLTSVNGTLRLEDKTDETTPQYWVTADASFGTSDADPLAKGDKVDLLGAADNRLCTVAVEAGTGGSVSVTNGGPVSVGTEVTVTATPKSGYLFVNWTENGQAVSTEASYTFEVTASRTLTAVFQRPTPQYTVMVQAGTGGSATGGGTFDAGTKATVTATPDSGYRFVNWTENGQAVSAEASYTFAVTASRTLTAVFERTAAGGGSSGGGGGGTYTPPTTPTYPPTVERPSGGGGAAAVSPSRPERGDTVTVTPKPDDGYEVDTITVTDRDGKPVEVTKKPDGTYTFQQPSGKVTIGVTYRPIDRPWNSPFTDVSEGSWYYEAVQFVQERGLMNGYSDGRFGANDPLSRAQLAQILFNKEGRPGVNYLLTFSDVAGEAWYTEAIRWAASQGIVGGYGNGTFGPNDPITREQLAVMLWRYVGSPAATNKELNFADADEISPFALGHGERHFERLRRRAARPPGTGHPRTGSADVEKLYREPGGKYLKKLAILFALTLCVALAGCNQPAAPQGGEPTQTPSGTVSTPPAEEPTQPASPTDEPTAPTPAEGEQTATLYIGTKAGGFAEYPMTCEGELTPEKLIQGIADLTGWDLTLAEPVVSGKGGMSVCLSNELSLFSGPPDPQKEEFHMYDAEQLAETILDSIQKTLQKGFVLEPGDPDTLDIWYYMEGDQPLELPALGLSWPIDQPYQWTGAESK